MGLAKVGIAVAAHLHGSCVWTVVHESELSKSALALVYEYFLLLDAGREGASLNNVKAISLLLLSVHQATRFKQRTSTI